MSKPKSLQTLKAQDKEKFKEEVRALASLMDQLSAFSEWKEVILPDLKEDLAAGKTAAQLRKKYLPHLQARLISIGLTSPDPKVALQAIRDSVDREEGTAVSRSDVTHKLEELPENELDSMILTKLSDLSTKSKSPKKDLPN